jgi:hypothetical protein
MAVAWMGEEHPFAEQRTRLTRRGPRAFLGISHLRRRTGTSSTLATSGPQPAARSRRSTFATVSSPKLSRTNVFMSPLGKATGTWKALSPLRLGRAAQDQARWPGLAAARRRPGPGRRHKRFGEPALDRLRTPRSCSKGRSTAGAAQTVPEKPALDRLPAPNATAVEPVECRFPANFALAPAPDRLRGPSASAARQSSALPVPAFPSAPPLRRLRAPRSCSKRRSKGRRPQAAWAGRRLTRWGSLGTRGERS